MFLQLWAQRWLYLCGIGLGAWFLRGGIVLLAGHILALERSLRVADGIVRHMLVRQEIGALHAAFGGGNLRVYVRVQFVAHTVPKQLLALEQQAVNVTYAYATAQMPQLLLIVILG